MGVNWCYFGGKREFLHEANRYLRVSDLSECCLVNTGQSAESWCRRICAQFPGIRQEVRQGGEQEVEEGLQETTKNNEEVLEVPEEGSQESEPPRHVADRVWTSLELWSGEINV